MPSEQKGRHHREAGAFGWCLVLYVALRSAAALRVSQRRSCVAFGCGSSLVAASGGQGGLGGLRFPPRPSLDSPLPLETPPLRYGAVAARAGRCAAGAGSISALRRISAVVWEAAGAGRCAAGAGWVAALLLHGFAAARRSSPGERERARRPSRALIEPGGVYAGFAAISS